MNGDLKSLPREQAMVMIILQGRARGLSILFAIDIGD
jgi:hypothetical protein